MTNEQALQIIEQALNLAVQKGAFNMQEVEAILNAVRQLKQKDA
jgi:hypothetical protein